MTNLTLDELMDLLTPRPSEMGFKDKDHLEYRSFPQMPIELWEWTISVLKSFELIMVVQSSTSRDGRQYAGGQVFAHPDGLEVLDSAVAKISEATSKRETE
ncbi:hypothetical protein [Roseibium sp. RKSG952]|uniref:hypothetical protein n=1 Tax=Roseibium sp. RKSG952 TaxID=2529384 RepID=UPI0012BC86EE|nr:hypothetical protein [Roseibium sp. RKSG952]MTH95485.1 hypothetical protein [Roseibium sp. RKSG952]